MADGKWISDLYPDTPLPDAARHVLTVRLEVVRDYLPLAAHEADRDVEHVHQLRVGTRRAGAALDIFSLCLPDKVYRTARKRLRKVRRAAGAARDWDVFLGSLAELGWGDGDRRRPGLDFLMGYAAAQRASAQGHLEEVGRDHPFAFDRLISETVAAVREPDDGPATLGDLARPMLSALVQELEDAAAQNLDDYDHLHRVRIIGKRLRYAMEVFADCFDGRFRSELYPAVEDMQEMLGNANDSHVAEGRLELIRDRARASCPADSKRYRPALEALLRYHRQRLRRERKRFVEWWRRWQRSGGEAALVLLLRPTPSVFASP